MRVKKRLPSLRGLKEFTVLRGAMTAGCKREGFRLVHFSVQSNQCVQKGRRVQQETDLSGQEPPPVAWMASRRESGVSKPIDNAFSGKARECLGRNESERMSSLDSVRIRRPRGLVCPEGSMVRRDKADAARHFGGVEATARAQGHVEATGETLLVPAHPRRSCVARITGAPGKSDEGERESDGHVVASKRSNVRGAKEPCCSAMLSPTREAGAG